MHARKGNHAYSSAIEVKVNLWERIDFSKTFLVLLSHLIHIEKEAIARDNKEEDNVLGIEKGQKINTIKKNKKTNTKSRQNTKMQRRTSNQQKKGKSNICYQNMTFKKNLEDLYYTITTRLIKWKNNKQAGAELGQAQE